MAATERIGVDELYFAYRKAKHYAFRDPNSAQGFIFADYEERLPKNLRALHKRLNRRDATIDADFVGGWTAIPRWTDGEEPKSHFYSSDPELMWKKSNAQLKHRIIGTASVDMQVVNAIWCMTSGARLDTTLKHAHVFASHPHRGQLTTCASGLRVSTSRPLFQYWPSQYAEWQRQGLRRMRRALREGREVVALTMDVRKFYHRLDANFLLSRDFSAARGVPKIKFSKAENWLNQFLVDAIHTWLGGTPSGGTIGLPVGWTSSAVLANVALRSFDQRVLQQLNPIYYGRYVDDVFLVAEPHRSFSEPSAVMAWLSKELDLVKDETDGTAWQITLPGLGESRVAFGEEKQKIFCLKGEAGLDLVRPIDDAIRRRSSEFRSLPVLPTDDERIATSALLTTTDASIEADALRKADAISVRRHSFALILKNVDEYRRNIEPMSWREQRQAFFGVFRRHVLTPRGVAELIGYIPRVFSIAASTGDWAEISGWIRDLVRVRKKMKDGVRGKEDRTLSQQSWRNLWQQIAESIVAGTGAPQLESAESIFGRLLELAKQPGRQLKVTWRRLKRADWLIRPRLLAPPPRAAKDSTRWPTHLVPRGLEPLRKLRGREFSNDAMMLATRVPETGALHRLDLDEDDDAEALFGALSELKYGHDFSGVLRVRKSGRIQLVNGPRGKVRLFVVSLQTSEEEWRAATLDAPVLTVDRFDNLRRLLDRVIEDVVRASAKAQPYLLLPELSLPQRWASFFATKLAAAGISVIAGLEYRRSGGAVVNEALLSFSDPGWGRRSVVFTQRKRRPAWEEARQVRQAVGLSVARSDRPFPVYIHGDLHVSVIICSDFTDAKARIALQGKLDLLVVPEWNKDVDGFATLLEAASLDLHAFIAQVNNRAYGDSRVRVAAEKAWERDLVRLRGGADDFCAAVDVDYHRLRRFQTNSEPPDRDFKPFPVGFKPTKGRRRV